MRFDVCDDVDSLTEVIPTRLGNGEQLVIKPSGTGHGDGIDFFFGGEGGYKPPPEYAVAR